MCVDGMSTNTFLFNGVICVQEEEEEDEEEDIVAVTPIHNVTVKSTVFIDSILSAMIPSPNDDSRCLLAISLIYSLVHNQGEFCTHIQCILAP